MSAEKFPRFKEQLLFTLNKIYSKTNFLLRGKLASKRPQIHTLTTKIFL
jgi:hypothetical protein